MKAGHPRNLQEAALDLYEACRWNLTGRAACTAICK